MRALELAVLYGVVGVGLATAAAVAARWAPGRLTAVTALDVLVLVPFWPLYGPLLFLGARDGAPRPPASSNALATLLADLPNGASASGGQRLETLAARVQEARAHLAEIERRLAQPELDRERASSRAEELERRGEPRAAAAARRRLASIDRLRAVRDRITRELTEVDELTLQLRVQAEVVRLSGSTADDTGELVQELLARVEGLEAILVE